MIGGGGRKRIEGRTLPRMRRKRRLANIGFFNIRFPDLIEMPTRNGLEAGGVGSTKGIQACGRSTGRRKEPRRPDTGAIGKAAPQAAILRFQL